jgi:hypothetical protein
MDDSLSDALHAQKRGTSIMRVDFGRWKLVISPSGHLEPKPGVMKMSVSPARAAA